MEVLQSILLGIIQGLTEFLPVSSSAHLSALPQIFGIKSELLNSLAFDVVLHAGTLCAVIFYFKKKVAGLLAAFFKGLVDAKTRKKADFKLGLLIIAATLPAVAAALLFEEAIEGALRNPIYTGLALIVFGGLLWLADSMGKKKGDMTKIGWAKALIIGFAQALSVIPGVSRSGITITAGLFTGLSRAAAAEFAFLLSMPAIFGAFVYQFKDILEAGTGGNAAVLAAGFIASAVSGFAAIAFLMEFIKKNSYLAFVIYRAALGVFIIAAALKAF